MNLADRHSLRVCLSWIRFLRSLRREYVLGEMERQAIEENLGEARRLRDLLKRRGE